MKQVNRGALPIKSQSASFRIYLFHETAAQNVQYLLLLISWWIIFKFLYPFPSFFSDSYSYIYAAASHFGANIWPIGYSRFLYFFHSISQSANGLTLFQYLFFEGVALYFYRTILFLFSPTKFTRIILWILLFINPLNLYLANFVSSDGLFAALSLLWLTTLIWLLYRPTNTNLLILSVTCFIAFTFRYNAMYYPLISAPAFFLVKKKLSFKFVGLALSPLLIIPFIAYTSNSAKQMSGTSQFPPILGGWQWSNNALYMREYIQEDTNHFPNPQIAELDRLARDFYRQVPAQNRRLPSFVGNFFIIRWEGPLKQYMIRHYGNDSSYGGVAAWAKPAPLFKQYGLYLIKRHPIPFLKYYILMNAQNYFVPPLEKLKVFNLGSHHIATVAVQWFKYPDQIVDAISLTAQGYVLFCYPYFFLLLNILFGWYWILFIRRKYFIASDKTFVYLISIVSALVLVNAAFSIFANIIVFRYQIFPMFTLLFVVLLMIDYNWRAMSSRKKLSGRFSHTKTLLYAETHHRYPLL